MTTTSPDPAERRRLFRLREQVIIGLAPLSEHQLEWDPYDERFNLPADFALISELAAIESAHRHLLNRLAQADRDLGTYLTATNQKIMVLARAIRRLVPEDTGRQLQEISLSEGGLACQTTLALAPGDRVHVQLSLPDHALDLAAHAQVKHVHRAHHSLTAVGLEFVRLRDSDRLNLSRHLIRRQADLHRHPTTDPVG